MVLECNRRSTWRHQLRELRDALGGHHGKNFHFSPPPPFSFAGGSRCGAYHDTGITEMDNSKMYFSHWEPPGVSERMWSVNLDASISGECQTIGGHSGRPSE